MSLLAPLFLPPLLLLVTLLLGSKEVFTKYSLIDLPKLTAAPTLARIFKTIAAEPTKE